MPKSNKVMVACVTFETVRIIEPAMYYHVNEIHLFHMMNTGVYGQFYGEVRGQLLEKIPSIRIVEHLLNLTDVPGIMRELLDIFDSSKKNEVLVNLSAGTSEYSAAAVLATQMSDNAVAFTVPSSEYTVKDVSLYYRGGKPVGLTSSVLPPREVISFNIERFDKDILDALECLKYRQEYGLSISASDMIEQLKEKGIWNYRSNDSGGKTDMVQKETMYYQRHFVNVWANNGWIDRSSKKTKYTITKTGMDVLRIFNREPRINHSG